MAHTSTSGFIAPEGSNQTSFGRIDGTTDPNEPYYIMERTPGKPNTGALIGNAQQGSVGQPGASTSTGHIVLDGGAGLVDASTCVTDPLQTMVGGRRIVVRASAVFALARC